MYFEDLQPQKISGLHEVTPTSRSQGCNFGITDGSKIEDIVVQGPYRGSRKSIS